MAGVLAVLAIVVPCLVTLAVMRVVDRHQDQPVAPDLRRAGDDPHANPSSGEAADRAIGRNSWMRPTF